MKHGNAAAICQPDEGHAPPFTAQTRTANARAKHLPLSPWRHEARVRAAQSSQRVLGAEKQEAVAAMLGVSRTHLRRMWDANEVDRNPEQLADLWLVDAEIFEKWVADIREDRCKR